MLAESLVSSSAAPIFVALIVAGAAFGPLLASWVRRGLPAARRDPIPLEPARFGVSPKLRRSPRHAVLHHRTLLTTFFTSLLALLMIPCVTALRALGVSGLEVAVGFVLPTLLVGLHTRRRSSGT